MSKKIEEGTSLGLDSLQWHVYSTSPRGYRSTCRKIFHYDDWQFAEKLAGYLREIGHEDVRVQLASKEEDSSHDD